MSIITSYINLINKVENDKSLKGFYESKANIKSDLIQIMCLSFDYKDLTSANEFPAFKLWKAYINTTKQEDPERFLKQKVGRSIFRYM